MKAMCNYCGEELNECLNCEVDMGEADIEDMRCVNEGHLCSLDCALTNYGITPCKPAVVTPDVNNPDCQCPYPCEVKGHEVA